MFAITGYSVASKLYEGRKSIVYRAVQESDGANVVIKLLRNDYPSARDLASIRHEFDLMRHLVDTGVAGVIKPIALEPHENTLATILEDVGGVTLREHVAHRKVDLQEFLDIGIKIAAALAEIHGANVIHKDIKPDNIIINRDNGQVRVTDFGVSTRLSREQQMLISPTRLEGTLAYMAPEQTGRMNRPIDYRSDLYALGCTLYEVLVRQRPFVTNDPMELVHCHIAKEPTEPHVLDMNVPQQVSKIVLKLMAKAALDRYQSAAGLRRDLERCHEQLTKHGVIDPFELGEHDLSDRFQVPNKLYGRELDTSQLMSAFDRVAAGHTEVVFVDGYSGIGKTALVSEIKRPIVRQRGYFIAGKIDQHQRSQPYSALIQAFGELVRQILTEPAERIITWKERLQSALGENGSVVTDVIPDFEMLLGKQPNLQELSAAEALNRFNEVFIDFIKVLATPRQPLVIFLDDLQWADAPSLKLLRLLATETDVRNLLLIGAYRDNEVSSDHPLMLTIDEIATFGGAISRIHLDGLGSETLLQIVADTLHCSPEHAKPLAELVHHKTGGNPFFVGQFLHALRRQDLLQFDPERGWQWSTQEIAAVDFTDNVVEMMSERIVALGEDTQKSLKLAACIGNRFGLTTVAEVMNVSKSRAAMDLWVALREGLVVPIDDTYRLIERLEISEADGSELNPTYRFVHDRVQQAAYELLPMVERKAAHLRIGRILLGDRRYEEIEDQVFEIVNHFGYAMDDMADAKERYRLTKLNYIAGKRAKRSAAYEPAMEYFRAGMSLLGDGLWADSEGLSMGLVFNLSECLYLSGDHEAAELLFEEVLERSHTPLEKASVYNLKLVLYGNTGRYPEAIDCAVQALSFCGEKFSATPGKVGVTLELFRTLWLLRGRSVESLEYLDELSDPRYLIAVKVLNDLSGPAYFHDADLFSVLALRLLNLTVAHGNSPFSAYAYGLYGMIAGSVLGNYEQGQKFGELSGRMNRKYNNVDLKAKLGLIVGGLINHWRNPIAGNYEILTTGYKEGRVAGDLLYTGYCAACLLYCMVTAGEPLDVVFRESHKYLEFLKRTKDMDAAQTFIVEQRMVLNLQGMTATTASFGDDNFNEEEFVAHLNAIHMKIPLSLYRIVKMRSLWLFGHWREALEHADKAREVAEKSMGLPFSSDYDFYHALNILTHAHEMGSAERVKRLLQAKISIYKMNKWATNCPANFLQKQQILLAEQLRRAGKGPAALNAYEMAIAMARKNRFPQDEAIACELAGLFHMDNGRPRMARSYLMDARYAYSRWGATAKVRELDDRFPDLQHGAETTVTRSLMTTDGESNSTISGALDLHSVMKASQAISSEIVLDKLLTLLLKIVIENAGARRGVFILQSEHDLRIVAEGRAASDRYEVDTKGKELLGKDDVPASIVNYVARTGTPVVLHDASESSQFSNDRYITNQRTKSILCTPITHGGDLVGVLFLENNLNTGVFTNDRLETIQMLSAQIAISIENASLYAQQERMTEALSRFVPTEFLELLGKKSILNVELGDAVQREITVLFSDIRSFTTLSEQMTPEENFTFLNSYLSRVGPVIRQHSGFIDKYIGDAIMALFPGEPSDCLHAAVAMQRHVQAFNAVRAESGQKAIEIGVGLHCGKLMLGTIGEDQRLEGTVIADAVNIASRLEGLTKRYGAPVVVSEPTFERIGNPGRFHHRYLGEVQLRGRATNIGLVEVYESDPPDRVATKNSTKKQFEGAVRHLIDGNLEDSRDGFVAVLTQDPADQAARYYLEVIAGKHTPSDNSGAFQPPRVTL
jgi:predicted ATPase/class 3 adenylate cyclase